MIDTTPRGEITDIDIIRSFIDINGVVIIYSDNGTEKTALVEKGGRLPSGINNFNIKSYRRMTRGERRQILKTKK